MDKREGVLALRALIILVIVILGSWLLGPQSPWRSGKVAHKEAEEDSGEYEPLMHSGAGEFKYSYQLHPRI